MKIIITTVLLVFFLAGCSRLEIIDGNCVELSEDFHDNFSKIQELSKELGINAPLKAVGNVAANGKMLLVVLGRNRSLSCVRENENNEFEFLLKDGNGNIVQDWITHEQHKLQTWGE